MMNKKITTIISIFLYIVATLYAIYMIYVCFNTFHYIYSLKKQGQLSSSGILYTILNFYIPNLSHYFFYSIILLVVGIGIQNSTFQIKSDQRMTYREENKSTGSHKEVIHEDDENNLETWFNDLKKE